MKRVLISDEGYALFIHLLLIILGGAFGGLLEFLNRFIFGLSGIDNKKALSDETKENELRFGAKVSLVHNAEILYSGMKFGNKQIQWIFIIHVLHGIGGAFAIVFALTSINQFSFDLELENKLFLISLYVVAGYAGSRILDHVKNNIENQLKENNQSVKQVQRITEDLSKRVNDIRDEIALEAEAGDVLNRAYGILEKPNENRSIADIQHIAKDLQDLLSDSKGLSRLMLRRCAIYLGRIYRIHFGDLERAILALEKFSKISEESNELDDDYAAILFNIACYKSLIAKDDGCLDRERLLNETHEVLQKAEAVTFSIRYQIFGNDAKKIEADDDLQTYRDWLKSKKSADADFSKKVEED